MLIVVPIEEDKYTMRENLLEKMELLRQQMILIALEFGLDHPDVLSYSQEIDRLHNQLLQLDSKQGRSEKRHKYRLYICEKRAHFA